MHNLKSLYKAKSVIVSHFSAYVGFILVISPPLPKIKYTSFVLEKGFIIFDAVAVINSGHLKL